MTLQGLYCDACGSRELIRVGDERYRCSHCGASVLVSALRATPASTLPTPATSRGWLFGVAALLLAVVFALVIWQAGSHPRLPRQTAIDPATVTLSAAMPVQALSQPTHRAKLLVMVSNGGKQPIGAPRVVASFYDGNTKLDTASDFARTNVLRPGESAPALIDVPPTHDATTGVALRRKIELVTPLRAVAVTDGPVLQLVQARLVERDGRFKLAARVQAPVGRFAMHACRASIVLHDAGGAVVAIGDGRCGARDVAPGESTLIDASFVRISAAAVARWTYHIDYDLVQPAPAPALAVAPANRQRTVTGTAEALRSDASWDAVDLLRH